MCFTCDKPIEVGQSYAWNQPNRYSRRFQWHQDCPSPRPSMLESNDKRSTAMAAFETAYDDLGELLGKEFETAQEFVDAASEVLNSCAEGVREAAEMWRESASNIEDGFGHSTYASDEMNDHADTYDSVADEVEQIIDQVDAFEADQYDDLAEWIEGAISTLNDDLGGAEGKLD